MSAQVSSYVRSLVVGQVVAVGCGWCTCVASSRREHPLVELSRVVAVDSSQVRVASGLVFDAVSLVQEGFACGEGRTLLDPAVSVDARYALMSLYESQVREELRVLSSINGSFSAPAMSSVVVLDALCNGLDKISSDFA